MPQLMGINKLLLVKVTRRCSWCNTCTRVAKG